MRRYHPVYPYEDENREELMSLAFQVFIPRRITLYCEAMCSHIKENDLVCQGQCIGFTGDLPVYSGIDGRVESVTVNAQEGFGKTYKILIFKEVHSEKLWSEVPWIKGYNGTLFLQQLGLHSENGLITEKDILWVDGVESEPYSTSCYRLFVEETVKVILGADVLGQRYGVQKIYFCVEEQWADVIYLLQKYLEKYASLLSSSIDFEIKQCERCCPPFYLRPGRLVFKPHIMIHAYNGFYEKMPATTAFITVSGLVDRSRNYIVPVGTHVADILSACGIQSEKNLRYVTDGVMTGKSVPLIQGVIHAGNTCLSVVEVLKNLPGQCIKCHACAAVCPMHLRPYAIDENTVKSCIQCGCCSYVCPSNIRISENIKHYVNLNAYRPADEKVSLKRLWRSQNMPVRKLRRSSNTSLKSMRSRSNMPQSAYVEIAPEFAEFMEPMEVFSDAPPHVHRKEKRLIQRMKEGEISPINLLLIILLLAQITACILGLYHL